MSTEVFLNPVGFPVLSDFHLRFPFLFLAISVAYSISSSCFRDSVLSSLLGLVFPLSWDSCWFEY